MNDLKKLVHDIMKGQVPVNSDLEKHFSPSILTHKDNMFQAPVVKPDYMNDGGNRDKNQYGVNDHNEIEDFEDAEEYLDEEPIQKTLSLEDMERQMIKLTLEKHRGRRKSAAEELKISERTLYRKIKEYGIE